MKIIKFRHGIIMLLLFSGISVLGQQMRNIADGIPVLIPVNGESVIKTNIINPSGAVICWLTDSDIERPRNRSMEMALSEMKAGALRFPYGALSNNYIWTRNPENTTNGLEPCVAVSKRAPGAWGWAVDEQGYFRKDLDFDEYVSLCRKVGAEPVVCVNIMSHVYDQSDDITIDTLIYYAREWVRYANITKGYNIKYWQLGNEQDHHANIYPLDEFKTHYRRMAVAMRDVDPDIMIAPGLLQGWVREMLEYCPDQIDYITCHQYAWFGGSETDAYDAWKDYGANIIPNIKKQHAFVRNSSKPNLQMFITETGITGGKYPDPQVFNLYKGLILFEMQMEQIALENVRYTFYWGTHTPWNGEFGSSAIATLFSNDDANENHMQADILTAINQHIQSKHLGKTTLDGIVAYSTISANDSLMVVFVLNKNKESKSIWLSTKNTGTFKSFEKWTFEGTDEFDANAEFKLGLDGQVRENVAETIVPPLSITIMRMELNIDGPNSTEFFPDTNEGFIICPNPVGDNITLSRGSEKGYETTATISDLYGRVVLKNRTDHSSMVDVSNLPPGIYFLHLFLDKRHMSQKFIKL